MPLHFDFEVGTDATTPSLLPGKDQATSGHHYVAIFPKKGEPFPLLEPGTMTNMFTPSTLRAVTLCNAEGTGGPEKRESAWATTSGREPPTTGGRTTIGGEKAGLRRISPHSQP